MYLLCYLGLVQTIKRSISIPSHKGDDQLKEEEIENSLTFLEITK
jgi:hypothetical protein